MLVISENWPLFFLPPKLGNALIFKKLQLVTPPLQKSRFGYDFQFRTRTERILKFLLELKVSGFYFERMVFDDCLIIIEFLEMCCFIPAKNASRNCLKTLYVCFLERIVGAPLRFCPPKHGQCPKLPCCVVGQIFGLSLGAVF